MSDNNSIISRHQYIVRDTNPNFETGNPLLLQSFRSINCLVKSLNNSIAPNPANISSWVKSYFDWYNEKTKIIAGENLNLVYFRNVNVIGENIMPYFRQFVPIAESCKNTGIGFSITIPDFEALNHKNIIVEAVNNKLLHTVAIKITNFPNNNIDINDLISFFINNLISIALIGDIEYILSKQILENFELNSSNFTIFPTKEDFLNRPINSTTRVKACSNIFRLVIDEYGDIYPCLGLTGIKYLSMGNIYNEFEESVFTNKNKYIDLEKLNSSGYNYAENEDVAWEFLYELPTMCQFHRSDVIRYIELK